MEEKELKNEEKYLKNTKKVIKNKIFLLKNVNIFLQQKLDAEKDYYQNNTRTFQVSQSQDERIDFEEGVCEDLKNSKENTKKIKRLKKQYYCPYFAKINIGNYDGDGKFFDVYIGMGQVLDENEKLFVVDWRCDVASLYYDSDVGVVTYTSCGHENHCTLKQKRQFKIADGKLEYYVDCNFNVSDEILMSALSQNASVKMKNIVSTIQTEQNKIIRQDFARGLLVQGVAGSGKTSIALHKIAYMLYKKKGTIKSADVLILSPSDMFSSYISQVLPSLEEDNANATTMEHIFRTMSKEKYVGKKEFLDKLFCNFNQRVFDEIAYKSSFRFLDEFLKFLNGKLSSFFVPKKIKMGKLEFLEAEIATLFFEKLGNLKIYERIEIMADMFSARLTKNQKIKDILKQRISIMLYNMLRFNSPLAIYNEFLKSVGLLTVEKLTYLDLPAYLMILDNVLKTPFYYGAKYFVVDEMQDLTPMHFEFFERFIDCQKLYLGDINQCIEKVQDQEYLMQLKDRFNLDFVALLKSYRCTKQIFEFSEKIKNISGTTCVARDGEEVEVVCSKNQESMIEEYIKKYSSKFDHIAILCKNVLDCKRILQNIKNPEVLQFLEEKKVVIDTAYNVKGVEFDMVIIPFVDCDNFVTELDRNLLYVAVTRALHKLVVTFDGNLTKLII